MDIPMGIRIFQRDIKIFVLEYCMRWANYRKR